MSESVVIVFFFGIVSLHFRGFVLKKEVWERRYHMFPLHYVPGVG